MEITMSSFIHNPNPRLEQRRQQLETIFWHDSRPAENRATGFQHIMRRVGQALVHWLTAGDAPRISLTTQGDTQVWKVYDPTDHQTYYFDDENNVRQWLDQRFNY
jgi:hypothetical protein